MRILYNIMRELFEAFRRWYWTYICSFVHLCVSVKNVHSEQSPETDQINSIEAVQHDNASASVYFSYLPS